MRDWSGAGSCGGVWAVVGGSVEWKFWVLGGGVMLGSIGGKVLVIWKVFKG
jgi:hypothetical protein